MVQASVLARASARIRAGRQPASVKFRASRLARQLVRLRTEQHPHHRGAAAAQSRYSSQRRASGSQPARLRVLTVPDAFVPRLGRAEYKPMRGGCRKVAFSSPGTSTGAPNEIRPRRRPPTRDMADLRTGWETSFLCSGRSSPVTRRRVIIGVAPQAKRGNYGEGAPPSESEDGRPGSLVPGASGNGGRASARRHHLLFEFSADGVAPGMPLDGEIEPTWS